MRQDDNEANDISAEITLLEQRLAATPANSEIHKTLMLAYNRALKIYAKNKNHRQDIDAGFYQDGRAAQYYQEVSLREYDDH